MSDKGMYFLGVDSAPAQGQRSDDGTLAVIRSELMEGLPGEVDSDFRLDAVFAERLRGRDVEFWSGRIHELHQSFGFLGIVMDHGGGGQWITPDLAKSRQTIQGITRAAKPIVARRSSFIDGSPLLTLLTRGDDDLRRLFPGLRHAQGDHVPNDRLNTLFRTAIAKTLIALPPAIYEFKREDQVGWSQEKLWACKCLTAFGDQCLKLQVETDEQGHFKLTSKGARKFFSTGKDDIHDAVRNAYIAWRVWLMDNPGGELNAAASESTGSAW